MTKSKFRLWALLPLILVIMLPGFSFLLFYIVFFTPDDSSISVWIYILLCFIISFFALLEIWIISEIRQKVIWVMIDNKSICVRAFYGLGSKRQFELNDFNGYTTSRIPARYSGTYEYLYLIMGNKRVIILSEFYHKNYYELKQALSRKVKFTGDTKFEMATELREIL